MTFRDDIQGLRAIAVLAVVLFHVGVTGLEGGFVGVDIFFTISGFLITANILAAADRGSFTFSTFYGKRLRRLFPSLLVTLLTTAAIGFLLLPPDRLIQLGHEAAAALFAVSNIYFANSQGYFDLDAHSRLLLHTWSLAVEEQFYLIWPALLIVLARFGRQITLIALLAVTAISILVTGLLTPQEPTTAFYQMPFRIYEFGLGAVLAAYAKPTGNERLSTPIFFVGLAMVAGSVLFIRADDNFPGFVALIPCVGTALIMWANNPPAAAAILGNSVAIYFGRISYCLYLTHWPLVVFYLLIWRGQISTFGTVALFFTSVISADLLSRFVEQPLLRKRLLPTRRSFAMTAATVAGFAAVMFAGFSIAAYPLKSVIMTEKQMNIARSEQQLPGPECDRRAPSGFTCLFGDHQGSPTVALIGDSHSEHFRPGLAKLFSHEGIKGLGTWAGGCIPILGAMIERDDIPNAERRQQECYDFARTAIRSAGQSADVAILAARWSVYLSEDPRGSKLSLIRAGSSSAKPSHRQSLAVFKAYLEKTVKYLRNRGVKVVLIDQIPPLGINRGLCLLTPHLVSDDCRGFDRAQSISVIRNSQRILKEVAAGDPNVAVISADRVLCPETSKYCLDSLGDTFLYRDDDHLNAAGSRKLVSALRTQILTAVRPPQNAIAAGSLD